MSDDGKKWYTVQVRSNMENKAVESLKMLIDLEDMGGLLSKDDILMPTETVSEIKNGKKTQRERKLYPGYIFVKMKLYDDDDELLEQGYYFVKRANGVIDFMGGESARGPRPISLRQKEVDEIFAQIEKAKGAVRPKGSPRCPSTWRRKAAAGAYFRESSARSTSGTAARRVFVYSLLGLEKTISLNPSSTKSPFSMT